MGNGLFLSVQEFEALPNKAKLTCLYENQVKTLNLFDVQYKRDDKIRFHQRIQYGTIATLIAGVIFLIKHAVSPGGF